MSRARLQVAIRRGAVVCLQVSPGTCVLIGLANWSQLGAILRQCIFKGQIEWDESLAFVGLLLSMLPMLVAAAHSSQSTLLGAVRDLLAALSIATSILVRRVCVAQFITQCC